MGVMTLAANKGSAVEIEVTGADEADALQALTMLINDCFGEGE
jgi:phosphocarrier protein HPr